MSFIGSLTKFAGITDEIEEQRKTAINIIEAGERDGVGELEITLSEDAGLNVKNQVKHPVEVVLGKKGTMTIKVKYKK